MVLVYAFRFLTSFLFMELILHFMYVVAIKDTRAWHGDSPFQLSMIGFWNLMIVWLKVRFLGVRAIHLQILTTFYHSSFYHGDSSDYGPLLMGLIRQRTWFAVWRIIIPLLGSGGVGIVATTSGLYGTLGRSPHGLIYQRAMHTGTYTSLSVGRKTW